MFCHSSRLARFAKYVYFSRLKLLMVLLFFCCKGSLFIHTVRSTETKHSMHYRVRAAGGAPRFYSKKIKELK